MPGTSDDSATGVGRPQDPEAALTAAERAHLAARETVPVDVRGDRETVRVDTSANRPTVRLPAQRKPGGGRRPAPLLLAAAVAAGWAAILSAGPVVVVLGLAQLADGGDSVGAVRLGLAGWLLGHGVPLDTARGPLGVAPLGIAALAAWRLARAGVHATRGIGARASGSPARALSAAAAVGVYYGLLGALAAAALGGPSPHTSPVRAGCTLALFGGIAALLGTARASGALGAVAARTPNLVRDAVRAGVVVALILLATGAAAAGISIAVRGGEASEVLAAYRTGVAGQAGLTLVCLAYAPNAAAWAVAYLVGPGFTLGTGSVVRVTEVSVDGLPALPVFAGLPPGPVGGAGAALVGVPVVVGMVGGWLLARRRAQMAARPRPGGGSRAGVRWPELLGAAALAGPVAGALLGLVAAASGGSLGAGRLTEVGPVAWQVAAVAAGVVALGAVVGAAAARTFAGQGAD